VSQGNVITVELDLSGLEVIRQEEGAGGEIVVLVQYRRTGMDCTRCKRATAKVHDRRIGKCRDLALHDRQVRLRVARRRFRCSRCTVRSRSGRYRPLVFGEPHEAFGRGPRGGTRRTTGRLRLELARRASAQAVSSAASALGTGERFARECFRAWAQEIVAGQELASQAPRHLGIDEYSLRKGHRYETVVCDLERRSVLASLPGRDGSALREWLEGLADPWAVRAVVIDMSLTYREVIELCLPAARVVADRFHVVRRVGRALDQVRLRLQRAEGLQRRGELYRSRYALLSDPANWTPRERRKSGQLFRMWPELKSAWSLKEGFRKWYRAESRGKAERGLVEWEKRVRSSGIGEFVALLEGASSMLVQWREQILNFFDFRLTNGFVEGKNNRTKTMQRQAYGYANPANLRLRILLPAYPHQ
jgi:transposase